MVHSCHAAVSHSHVFHGQNGARAQCRDFALHAFTRSQRCAGVAGTVDRLGEQRVGPVLARHHHDVVGLADAETELIHAHRLHVLTIGGKDRHRQPGYPHVEEAHRRGVDDTQAHPFARLEQAGPVVGRSLAIDQKRIAGHVGQIGGVHAHVAPFLAILDRGVEPVAFGVAEEIQQRALAAIVVACIGLEIGEDAARVLAGVVRQHHHVVAIGGGSLGLFRRDDDGAVHAHLLLHRRVRVVPVGAGLAQLEAIGVGLARRDGDIAVEARRAVHDARQQQPMPVDRGRLAHPVGGVDHHLLALAPAQGWRRHRAADHLGVGADAIDGDAA